MIAPFETKRWEKGDPDPKYRRMIWEIVPNHEWGIKTLAQQSDLDQQMNLDQQVSLLSVALLTNAISQSFSPSRHDELKRKRRLHSSDKRLFYVQMLDMKCAPLETTTKEPENGFWCSPFYLRLNPMEYIYCKLSGHHNLHFF
jgi:hypothetical protein